MQPLLVSAGPGPATVGQVPMLRPTLSTTPAIPSSFHSMPGRGGGHRMITRPLITAANLRQLWQVTGLSVGSPKAAAPVLLRRLAERTPSLQPAAEEPPPPLPPPPASSAISGSGTPDQGHRHPTVNAAHPADIRSYSAFGCRTASNAYQRTVTLHDGHGGLLGPPVSDPDGRQHRARRMRLTRAAGFQWTDGILSTRGLANRDPGTVSR